MLFSRISILILVVSVSTCKPRVNNSGLEAARLGANYDPNSLSAQIDREAADISAIPSKNVSDVVKEMVASSTYENMTPIIYAQVSQIRSFFGDDMLKAAAPYLLKSWLGSHLPQSEAYVVDEINSIFQVALGSEMDTAVMRFSKMIAASLAFAKNHAWVAKEAIKFLKLPPVATLIDSFPQLPLQSVPSLQNAALVKSAYYPNSQTVPPFDNGKLTRPEIFQLKADGCTPPIEDYSGMVFGQSVGIRKGFQMIDRYMVPCFHENNDVAALLLNFLSNTQVGRTESLKVSLPNAEPRIVTSYDELLSYFKDNGYTFEMYQTRAWADFLNMAYFPNLKDMGTKYSLRTPLWLNVPTSKGNVNLPTEHSEIGIMIHKDRKRLAQIRFYLGFPVGAFQNIPSMWRAHHEKQHSWIGTRRDMIAVYPPEKLADAKPFFAAMSETMSAFQNYQSRLSTIIATYGYMVCDDSVAVATLMLKQHGYNITTQAFPLVRFAGFQPKNQPFFSTDSFLENMLNLSSGMLSQNYPSDITFITNSNLSGMENRLSLAFPKTDSDRFKFLPQVTGDLTRIIWKN